MTRVEEFFATARERQAIYLRRAAKQPRPWTDDPVFLNNRFCNVFREQDRTTAWFRQHVRDPMREVPEVVLATVVFRWFNRITTGEAIFCQPDLQGRTAFDKFLRTTDVDYLRRDILSMCHPGPYVTGAYTINTNTAPLGTSKLDGVLQIITRWLELHPDWREVAMSRVSKGVVEVTLQGFCDWCRSPNLGPFMTYEVACDLRHTRFLRLAMDINTWANVGPGARRGLNRIFRGLTGKDANRALSEDDALEEMRGLLRMSRDARHWPQRMHDSWKGDGYRPPFARTGGPGAWPRWELREVEHWLCEYDKHCRVSAGEGRPRGSFDGRAAA